MKQLRYRIEALLLRILFGMFRILPMDTASALGGKLAQCIGPWLKWHRVARYNLKQAMPALSEAERDTILHNMWNNLGRTFAEYPWLGTKQFSDRVTITPRAKEVLDTLPERENACIFAGGHFSNWEVLPLVGALEELDQTLIYRHSNNPFVDATIRQIRERYCHDLHPKGRSLT